MHKIKDRPPIPFKPINSRVLQERKSNQNKSLNFDLIENPDQTQESVRLNESDLKQLEYDYTLDVDDDDDNEDKENFANRINNTNDFRDLSKNFTNSFAKTDFTNVSPNNTSNLDKSMNITLSNRTNEKVNNDLLVKKFIYLLKVILNCKIFF